MSEPTAPVAPTANDPVAVTTPVPDATPAAAVAPAPAPAPTNAAEVTIHLSPADAEKLREQLEHAGTANGMAVAAAPAITIGEARALAERVAVAKEEPTLAAADAGARRQGGATEGNAPPAQSTGTPLPPGIYGAELPTMPMGVATGYCPTSVDMSLTGEEAKTLASLAAGLAATGALPPDRHPREALRWILQQLAD